MKAEKNVKFKEEPAAAPAPAPAPVITILSSSSSDSEVEVVILPGPAPKIPEVVTLGSSSEDDIPDASMEAQPSDTDPSLNESILLSQVVRQQLYTPQSQVAQPPSGDRSMLKTSSGSTAAAASLPTPEPEHTSVEKSTFQSSSAVLTSLGSSYRIEQFTTSCSGGTQLSMNSPEQLPSPFSATTPPRSSLLNTQSPAAAAATTEVIKQEVKHERGGGGGRGDDDDDDNAVGQCVFTTDVVDEVPSSWSSWGEEDGGGGGGGEVSGVNVFQSQAEQKNTTATSWSTPDLTSTRIIPETPSIGSSSLTVAATAAAAATPPIYTVPELYSHYDPDWKIGQKLSEETHNLLFFSQPMQQLGKELKELIEKHDPTIQDKCIYPGMSRHVRKLANKLYLSKPYKSPSKLRPEKALLLHYQAWLHRKGDISPVTLKQYSRYLFAGTFSVHQIF